MKNDFNPSHGKWKCQIMRGALCVLLFSVFVSTPMVGADFTERECKDLIEIKKRFEQNLKNLKGKWQKLKHGLNQKTRQEKIQYVEETIKNLNKHIMKGCLNYLSEEELIEYQKDTLNSALDKIKQLKENNEKLKKNAREIGKLKRKLKKGKEEINNIELLELEEINNNLKKEEELLTKEINSLLNLANDLMDNVSQGYPDKINDLLKNYKKVLKQYERALKSK